MSASSAPPASPSSWLDRLGMGLAALCAVHCLLLPVLLGVVPLLISVHSDFHLWMWWVVLPITALAIGSGFWQHRSLRPAGWAVAGLVCLAIGLGTPSALVGGGAEGAQTGQCCSASSHAAHGAEAPPALREASVVPFWIHHGTLWTTLGGGLLAFSHWRNSRLRNHRCEGTSAH